MDGLYMSCPIVQEWDNVTDQIVQVLDKRAGQGDISQIVQVYNKRAGSRGQEPNRAGTK